MREYHRFNQDMIDQAVAAARAHEQAAEPVVAEFGATPRGAEDGRVTAKAECIDLPVTDQQLCLSLPFSLGDICLPIPGKAKEGGKVRACLDIFLVAGEPVGVRLIVSSGRAVLMRRIVDAM